MYMALFEMAPPHAHGRLQNLKCAALPAHPSPRPRAPRAGALAPAPRAERPSARARRAADTRWHFRSGCAAPTWPTRSRSRCTLTGSSSSSRRLCRMARTYEQPPPHTTRMSTTSTITTPPGCCGSAHSRPSRPRDAGLALLYVGSGQRCRGVACASVSRRTSQARSLLSSHHCRHRRCCQRCTGSPRTTTTNT